MILDRVQPKEFFLAGSIAMVKKLLTRVVGALPRAAQSGIRQRYWQVKSKILYQSLYGLLDLQHTLDSGLTVKVASKGEWWIYNDIFVNGEYDVPIRTALAASSENPFVVLDLGANVGYFTFRLLDLIRRQHLDGIEPEITMVEGSPQTFGQLDSRVRSQNLAPASVHAVHGLVGQRTGSTCIRESAIHVKAGIVNVPAKSGVNVGFVDLSTLMKDQAVIHLLKCDIEGAELMFIENYDDLLQKVRHAVFELHHDQCDTKRCVNLLQNLGFRQTVLRATDSFSVCLFSRD
jgi:FkbM family methyltransferase